MRYVYRHGDQEYDVEVQRRADGTYHVVVDGVTLELGAQLRGDALELNSAAGVARFWISRVKDLRFVTAPGVGEVVLEREERRRGSDEQSGNLASPMPGKIVKVLVEAGSNVVKGDTLVIVEAMKTELRIAASRDGKVTRVHGKVGEMCEAGKALVELGE